jgi:hypothetical protein
MKNKLRKKWVRGGRVNLFEFRVTMKGRTINFLQFSVGYGVVVLRHALYRQLCIYFEALQ